MAKPYILSTDHVQLEYEMSRFPMKGEAVFLLSHPHPIYGGSMSNKVIDQLYRRLSGMDKVVLRYNFRGVGQSTGHYADGLGESDDLEAVVGHLKVQHDVETPQIHFIGYSFGSWICHEYLAQKQVEAQSLMLIAPPVTLYDFTQKALKAGWLQVYVPEKDELVESGSQKRWFEALLHPNKHMDLLEGADHYFVGRTSKLIKKCLQKFTVKAT